MNEKLFANKRFIYRNYEDGTSSLQDTKRDECYVDYGLKMIGELLNELDDENKELKKQNKFLKKKLDFVIELLQSEVNNFEIGVKLHELVEKEDDDL